jgi:GNAT superfamily N-acetyltransferase
VVKIHLRDATLTDMPALQAIFERASLSNEGDRTALLEHPDALRYSSDAVRRGNTRVAVRDDRIVGFASTVVEGTTCELEDLFVDPDYMRQGIGRALIVDAITRARDRHAAQITVTANPHALAFYLALGFESHGTTETRFGPGTRMHLPISTYR